MAGVGAAAGGAVRTTVPTDGVGAIRIASGVATRDVPATVGGCTDVGAVTARTLLPTPIGLAPPRRPPRSSPMPLCGATVIKRGGPAYRTGLERGVEMVGAAGAGAL